MLGSNAFLPCQIYFQMNLISNIIKGSNRSKKNITHKFYTWKSKPRTAGTEGVPGKSDSNINSSTITIQEKRKTTSFHRKGK